MTTRPAGAASTFLFADIAGVTPHFARNPERFVRT
jgi:hypothetical protein